MQENARKTLERKISSAENANDFFSTDLIFDLQRAREGHRACAFRKKLRLLREQPNGVVDFFVGYEQKIREQIAKNRRR